MLLKVKERVCMFNFLVFTCLTICYSYEKNKTGLTGRFSARKDISVLK